MEIPQFFSLLWIPIIGGLFVNILLFFILQAYFKNKRKGLFFWSALSCFEVIAVIVIWQYTA